VHKRNFITPIAKICLRGFYRNLLSFSTFYSISHGFLKFGQIFGILKELMISKIENDEQ
jgi:hypothetical protein